MRTERETREVSEEVAVAGASGCVSCGEAVPSGEVASARGRWHSACYGAQPRWARWEESATVAVAA